MQGNSQDCYLKINKIKMPFLRELANVEDLIIIAFTETLKSKVEDTSKNEKFHCIQSGQGG